MEPLDPTRLFTPWEPGLFSLVFFGLLVMALVGVLLFLSGWLGARQPSSEKLRAYESGIIPTGSARLRYPIAFYLVAVFFLIFDVEGAFIFSWAVAARDLGWSGWFQITGFILILMLGLVYIWKKGGLDWGPTINKTKRR